MDIIEWFKNIPSDIISGVISGFIVGITLLLINIYIEKRKDNYNYKNSFSAEKINEIVENVRKASMYFDEYIILLGEIDECFQDKIINSDILSNISGEEIDYNNSERQIIINYYELIDNWTSEALMLINTSRSFPKSREVKKNIKCLKDSSWNASNIPIKDLVYANMVLSSYFLNIVGNKDDNLDYEYQCKPKYNYSCLRNPSDRSKIDVSTENKQIDNKKSEMNKQIYKDFDKKRKKIKVNLLDADYYWKNKKSLKKIVGNLQGYVTSS